MTDEYKDNKSKLLKAFIDAGAIPCDETEVKKEMSRKSSEEIITEKEFDT